MRSLTNSRAPALVGLLVLASAASAAYAGAEEGSSPHPVVGIEAESIGEIAADLALETGTSTEGDTAVAGTIPDSEADDQESSPEQDGLDEADNSVETPPSKVPPKAGLLVSPQSVAGQIALDRERKDVSGQKLKDRLDSRYGLSLGADYFALYQHADPSPEEDAASGIARFYGHWTLVGRGSIDSGALVFKVEDRHRLGTTIVPQILGPVSGYAGITAATYSDQKLILTNLYWTQAFVNNKFAFNAGIVDVTDYFNVHGMINIWTEFNNLAFATDATVPAPSQGVGAVGRWMVAPSYYVIAGFADANGNPHDPLGSIESFFDQSEYFKHLEIGWIDTWNNRFSNNIHVSFWDVDERVEAGVPDGWGFAPSFSHVFGDKWTTFLRGGYSDGGGAFLARSVSTGFGYELNERDDGVGFAVNWGRPPKEQTEGEWADQVTFEAYYRNQYLPHVQFTPSVQYIVDPALAPEVDDLWIPTLRVRFVW